jgi:TonB-linked SusC/RagA family outer membrane protein
MIRSILKRRGSIYLGLGLALMLFTQASWAQQVSGKVIAEDGSGLPGVNVIIEGTNVGTTTDVDGAYALQVEASDAVLVFSFIGYKTERVVVQGRTNINLTLQPDLITLGEVVVVGYGTQKKTSMTSAVSTIASEDVVSRQTPNTISLLQGRTPGLQIIQNSALPGAENNQIRIRGLGTFDGGAANPLVLIDGVEGDLSLLNPNNIEDVSVLKDAASSAIYGSRAANGVILVTTKKGKEGRLSIEYNYNYSTQNPSVQIDRITNSVEYMELVNKAIDYSQLQQTWRYTDAEIQLYRDNAAINPKQYPSSDWTKWLIRRAPIQKHFLNVNGGKNGTTFNVGFGVLDETGMLLATDFSRYDAQINFKSNLGGRVTFGSNISLAKSKRRDSAFKRGSSGGDLIDGDPSEDQMLSAYAAPPISSPVLPDGSGRFTARAFPNKGGNKNPIAIATDGGGKVFDKTYLVFSPYLNVKIIEGLNAEIRGALRTEEEMAKALVVRSDGYEFFPDTAGVHNYAASWNGQHELAQRNTRENQYTLFGTLQYTKSIASAHNINVLVGYQQESYRLDRMEGWRINLPSKKLWELNAGPEAGQTTSGTAHEWAMVSFFGRLTYDFRDKYLFEASFRDDASSRFPEGHRWALFPSVSAGWRIAQEPFLAEAGWLDEFKLRGSWGQLGNQQALDEYPYQTSLTSTPYNFNGTLVQGQTLKEMYNANIRWETTTVTDVGLDFSVLNQKIFGSVDWYNKRSEDILRQLQVPDHIGVSAPYVNNGTMDNRGWEIELGHRNKIGDFGYSISANLETYKNKLVKFGAREINGVNIREEGLPYNQYYVLINDGVYQTQEEIDNGPVPAYSGNVAPKPGTLKYRDVSGPEGVPDGRIDLTYDRVPIDGLYPKFNYSFNINADFKGFDLNVFVQGVHGRKTYVTGWGVAPFQQAAAPPVWWRGAWDGEGTSNTIPHIFIDGYAPNAAVSTFWLGNSSYLRIKNVQLGYTIPSVWAKKIHLQSFRVYVSADNLYTRTKFFQGLDPERTASGNARAAIYPQATIYSFGARVVL